MVPEGLAAESAADERRQDQDPDEAEDHRGNGRQQPDDRLDDPPHPVRRELDDEDRAEEREPEAEDDSQDRRDQRGVDQRPGVQRVGVVQSLHLQLSKFGAGKRTVFVIIIMSLSFGEQQQHQGNLFHRDHLW